MAWHLMSRMIVDQSAKHATLLGKWWIAFMFICRFIFITSLGGSIYADEQSKFVCNTKQPGCAQVCYNMFAPLSQLRFWEFQILATGAPSMIFVVFAMHRLALVPSKPDGKDANKEMSTQTSWRYSKSKTGLRNRSKGGHKEIGNSRTSIVPVGYNPVKQDKNSIERQAKWANLAVVRAYIFNVLFTTIAEAVCLFGQWYFYQWTVPEYYECITYPCPKIVECYISRPMEKTIFLIFMFVIGGICLLLNFLELNYLGWKRLKHYITVRDAEMFIQPSVVLGTYEEIIDAALEYPIRRNPRYRKSKHAVPSAPVERMIDTEAKKAPPGYYTPEPKKVPLKEQDVDFKPAGANLPPKTLAASNNTSETELSSIVYSTSHSSIEKVEHDDVIPSKN